MASKKKTNVLKRTMTFSGLQVLLFVVAFAAVGTVAILQDYAAPPPAQNTGVCNMVSPITVGQNYSGVVTSLPNWTILNMFTTYGDGSTWNYVLGQTDNGSWNVGGYPAKVAGTTTFKITGYTKHNDKQTAVYATCFVQVNPV